MVERNLAKVDVAGSSPVSRSLPSQFLGRDFRLAPYPSGKGEVCKTFMHQFESDRRLDQNQVAGVAKLVDAQDLKS